MQNFEKIVEDICKKSPLQKKKLQKYLSKKDDNFLIMAEEFATHYLGYLKHENISLDYAVDAYLKMCHNMMKSQITFMKTGRYPTSDTTETFAKIYAKEKEMKSYMIGLAISQFLWASHYEMFIFFEDCIRNGKEYIRSYLEIGPGHGLFLNKAMEYVDDTATFTVIDISPISINITKSIMNYFNQHKKNITYYNVNILEFESSNKYDFITIGEVLEHLNCPEDLLVKLSGLLAKGGKVFISTCANCPAIDHVYHFKTIGEIREIIYSCGFYIENELVLPVEDLPMTEIIDNKITINYCALLKGENVEKN
jgi:2-polyprenyl-3-methyl-5-hydroxy-6-metoxy-1,4-benzoquinol methylase